MATLLCYVYFIVLTAIGFNLLTRSYGVLRVPYTQNLRMRCSGLELLFIFMFATGVIGLMPVLSIRLATLEILCLIGIVKSGIKIRLSVPQILFIVFLLWTLLGLSYTPMPSYGVRMMLKYVYPLLVSILAFCVVRDAEVFMKAAVSARVMAFVAVLFCTVPYIGILTAGVWWLPAALSTHCIAMAMFSLAMVSYSHDMRRSLCWFVFFMLPSFIWVIRTGIMGTMVALAVFSFIKYGVRSLPLVAVIAVLSVCSLFYVPAVKSKMYFQPEKVTVSDFLAGNVEESNIRMNGRSGVWEYVEDHFCLGHEWIGSGTGRVQTWFYEEAEGFAKGGQLHNDWLVIRGDNGYIGMVLYVVACIAVVIHCMRLYRRSGVAAVRLCALVAGSSLCGIVATMYSDNTISYSMATIAYPWGFYGMALGMRAKEISDLE